MILLYEHNLIRLLYTFRQGSTINNNGFYPDNDSQLLSLDTTTIHQQQDYNHHHHHHQQQQQQQQQIIDLSTFDPELGLFTLWNNHNNHLRHLSENDVFHYASSDTFDKQR
jgi:hypothetical protein